MRGMKFGYYFYKLLSFLRAKQAIAGLEISDTVLRVASFDKGKWAFSSVRLEPGVMDSGRIKDRGKFIYALKEIKSQVFGRGWSRERAGVVVSLSSVSIYSQVFNLPASEGKSFDDAVDLNVKMVSPMEVSKAYSGWQVVGRNGGSSRVEILASFIDRQTVDELSEALFESGFVMAVLESKGITLARILRESSEGFDASIPYIIVSLDNSGIDFLIIRNGYLYFEYFSPWRDLVDERGQLTMPVLEAAIVRNLHQVLNFYNQNWPERIEDVVIAATALGDEVIRISAENFSLRARNIKLSFNQQISAEWFISLGCGLRGVKPRKRDDEISLLDAGAKEEFYRERFLQILSFWRVLVPASLGFLAALFLAASLFFSQTKSSLLSLGSGSADLSEEQTEEGLVLRNRVAEFNRSVAIIKSVEKSLRPASEIIKTIFSFAGENGLSISRLTMQSSDQPITLFGKAKSNEDISRFRKTLEDSEMFAGVDLRLSGIIPDPEGYSFSLTFLLEK